MGPSTRRVRSPVQSLDDHSRVVEILRSHVFNKMSSKEAATPLEMIDDAYNLRSAVGSCKDTPVTTAK